jgi:hypothetical protein
MRYVRVLMFMLVGFFLLPMLAFAQDTLATTRSVFVDTGADLLTGLLAIAIPILTGYLVKALVNVMKRVDAFAVANPLIKQLAAFAISFILSWIASYFGTSTVGIVLNTVIGGALAQVFYNGKKLAALSAPAQV